MATTFLLPGNTEPASATNAGIVKIGTGINVDGNGSISTDLSTLGAAAKNNPILTGVAKLTGTATKAAGSSTTEVFRVESSDNQALFQVMQNGDTVIAGILKVNGTGESTFAGDVSIGGKLTVAQTATASADLSGTDLTLTGNLVVDGNTQLGDNASQDTTVINGVTTIKSANLKTNDATKTNTVFHVVDSANAELFQVKQNGDAIIGGVLTVSGAGTSTFAGNVSINGQLLANGGTVTANMQGTDLTLSGNLIVQGNSQLGDPSNGTDTTTINGVTTINTGMTTGVANASTTPVFQILSADTTPAKLFQVMANGDAKVGNNLTVAQSATVTAAMTGQDLTLNGNLNVKGNTTLGDASTDTITITGTMTMGTALNMNSHQINNVSNPTSAQDAATKNYVDTKTLDTFAAPAADLSLNGKKITNLATPVNASDAATKSYVDNYITGLDIKQSVRVASTANVAIATGGLLSIDGVTLVAGDRVLLKNQTTATENGIYVAASGAWTRAADADNSPAGEVTSGMFCFVEDGTTYKDTGWVLATNNPISIGTTALNFTQFSGAGSVTTSGGGLTQNGTTFSLNPATTTTLGGVIVPSTGGIAVDASGNISLKAATATMKGGIMIPSTSSVSVDASGNINVLTGTDLTKAGDGTISVDSATTATANKLVKRDGSGNITVASITASSATINGTVTTTGTISAGGKIVKVNNVSTEGNFGVQTVAKNASDMQLTATTATTVATFTPTAQGNFLIYIYFRVVTATTNLTLTATYNDGTGAQTQSIVVGSQAVGSYSVSPLFINATTGAPITITATAGTANNVYVSANIAGM